MKNSLKRVVALLCAVAMIAGGCFVSGGETTKASDTTVQTEWEVASQVGDITSTGSNVGKIYYAKTGLDIQLNKEKTEGCYMLYIKVYLQGEAAVDCLGGNTEKSINGAYVEIANKGDTNMELCWTPALWAEYGIELQTGVNELYLPLDKFKDANAEGNDPFSVGEAITYFRIYNTTVSGCTGVILDEVKIVDVSPVVQEYPNGATATVEPTENVPNGYGFAGWYTDKACDNVLSGTTASAAYAKFVKEEVLSVKTQYVTREVETEWSLFSGEKDITTSPLQGKTYYENASYDIQLDESRDYYVLYVKVNLADENAVTSMQGAIIELTNYGCDNGEISWSMADKTLQTGVNELYLAFSSAVDTSKSTNPAFDIEKAITHFRIYNVAKTDCSGVVLNEAKILKSAPELMIADCDSTEGLTLYPASSTVTSTAGRYQEGSGAFILENDATQMKNYITLSTPLNLSQYTDGSLCFDFFVNNRDSIYYNLIVEFGNDLTNRYRWVIPKAYLNTGWNEICLSLADTPLGALDITQMDMFRVYQNSFINGDTSYTSMTTIVDNVRVTRNQSGLKFADCDSTYGLTLSTGSVTKTAGRYQQGKGAYILENDANQVKNYFTLSFPRDLTKYTDGSLCFDFYVSNASNIYKNLIVEFGNDFTNRYRWVIPKAYLNTGWNEICLSLADTPLGTLDITQMDMFRVYQNGLSTGDAYSSLTTIVDNIRVEKTQTGLEISNCDSSTGLKTGSVTTEAGRYKEGNGAYILADESAGANVRVRFTLSEAMDLTGYTDGSIHFSFYIMNPSLLPTYLIVDFGNDSSFGDNSAYYRWAIPKGNLQAGWNEICLALSKATTPIKAPDITKMTDFRILQGGSSWSVMTTIVDNIRIETKEEPFINTYADLRFVTTVDSLNYANVGFKIGIGANSMEVSSKEVYGTLYGVSNANETLKYTPDVFTIESSYFKTHTLTNIPDTAFDTEITITPFWTTQDDTKVYGTAKTCTVNGEIAADATEEEETDLRVVFSSDIHYTALVDCYNGKGEDAATARMEHWVKCIKAEHEKDPIDLLVINGDLSLDYWSTDSLTGWYEGLVDNESKMTEAFIGNYLKQVKDAGIDVWVMPGNHELYTDDVWSSPDMAGNARQGYKIVGDNLFLFMDNYSGDLENKTETSDATYTATNTDYIKQVMDANTDLDVYIISHYFDTTSTTSDGTLVESSLQTLLADTTYGSRIKGLYAGHTHGSTVIQLGDTWGSKTIAETGNFSYTFSTATSQPFWGFRELIITEDSAYSQYISVDGITGDESTSSYTRKTTDSIWYY